MVGPVCETGDYLALDRDLPQPQPGDLLAVMTAGAYGAVQAGTYNTRALVPEVLVRGRRMGAGAAAPGGRRTDRARPPAALALTDALPIGIRALSLLNRIVMPRFIGRCLDFARWYRSIAC